MDTVKRKTKKTLIGIVGGTVLVIGIIMIPYPGPGWLVVFAALGILSTEFEWAHRLLHFAKGKYDAWGVWLSTQKPAVRVGFWLLTALVVVLTIWLLNGYGIINNVLNLGWDWLQSPLVSIFR